MKRLFCLFMSVVMVLGILFGCGNKQPITTDPTQDTTPSQTQPTEPQPTEPSVEDKINSLDLPDLWKQELLYAVELGMPMEKVQQATISGAEMAELLDYFVEYANPDKLAEWQALMPKLRTHKDALTRFDAMGALFLAARTASGEWAEFKENFKIEPSNFISNRSYSFYKSSTVCNIVFN